MRIYLSLLDYPLISTVHRYLRASGFGEQGTAHFGGEFGYIAASDIHAQYIVAFVLLNAHAVVCGSGLQDVITPYLSLIHI